MSASDELGGGLPLVVIPCFNEERRLDVPRLLELAGSGRVHLLFVDDGSTDGTAIALGTLRENAAAVDVLEPARATSARRRR